MTVRRCIASAVLAVVIEIWGVNASAADSQSASAAESQSASANEIPGDDRLNPDEATPLLV